ncbi:MAG TPA: cell division protein FtsZ [Sutterella sp.]|nr:cell division protein FtsZ [Sutterella sp.]
MPIQMVNDHPETFVAVVKVFGVGGGGGNAVEHMIDREARGITFIAANTDRQALNRSRADIVIPLGKTGLGAGARPEVGMQTAQDAAEQIREALEGTHLLFITAGMGGGTGTGAAPVIASIAREMGILTVAVVTKPFEFEGARRMRQAQAGIDNLKEHVDSLIVILNDKLEDEVGGAATIKDCFAAADEVLYRACNGIAEIIHTPGIINVDFEDLRTVMSERGTAMMGTATAKGPDRAKEAAEKAIACPLLEGANLQGARGLLVYITASPETMCHADVRQVMTTMTNFVSKDANVIVGTAFDDTMGEELRVTVVATGLDDPVREEASMVSPVVNMTRAAPQAQSQPRSAFSQKTSDFFRSNARQAAAPEPQVQEDEPEQESLERPRLEPIARPADAQQSPLEESSQRRVISGVPSYLRNNGGFHR